MNLAELAEHRIRLLLKKSEGKATESDLEQLEVLAESMRKIVPSVLSEKDEKFMDYAEKKIATLEGESINDSPDGPPSLDFSN